LDNGKEQTDENLERKFQEYEEIMRVIKEATGVSDISEVIGRFEKQGERKQHLSELQSQCEKKLESTKKDLSDIQSVHDDWKFKGEARNVHSLNLLNELKQHLHNAQQTMKDAKIKSETSTKFLVQVESGVRHVADKLELNIKENPLDSLEETVAKIETMVHSVKGKDIPEVIQLFNLMMY
jgi:exonuclease VII small subunit